MSKSAARELAKARGLEFYDEEAEMQKVPEVKAMLDRVDAFFAERDQNNERRDA